MTEIWAAVLGHEVGLVGLDSDFFALGGHSLKATLMINRLHRQFNVKVPLAEIFKSPTVRGVAAYIREAKEETYSAIEPAEKSDYYPLSSAQKRLYVLQRLDTGSLVYHIPLVMRLAGAVKAPRFREIFARLIRRHQSLRTSFELVGGEPVQRVQREVDFEIEYYNIAAKDAKRREIKNFIRSFDLSKPPLLRVGLIREKEERYVLMVDVHHIVADGLSMNILVREFAGLYRQETLPLLRLQYRDYALWQQRQVKQRRLCSQEQFWREEFGGEIPVLHLPLDFPRPPVQSFAGDSLTFEIDAAGIRDLRELCRLQEVSLFMMVLAVFNVLLFKLSDQEDLVVGTPVAARRHEDLQPLIGMFVNTLALRHQPRPEMTFRGFVRQIRRHTLRAFENQEYPFEELVGGLQLERDAGRNPLFDVMVALQNTDPPLEALPGLEWRPYDGGSGLRVARFDLTLVAVEAADRLRFTLEFCRRLFRRQTMVRLADYFKRIVSAVSAEPGQLLKGIEIIPPAEKVRILNEFSGSSPLPAPQGSLLTWLSHRADEGADCIALGGRALAVSDFAVVSYRELFGRAEQLARRLRAGGCRENSLVAIKVSPCLDMVTGILGILKGGGAFMPIDPAAPPERVRDMLEDSGAEIVLSDRSLADCRGERRLPNHRSTLCPAPHTSLAYVIYTSGSSGRPKGIPVEHRSLLNLCRWHNGHFGIDCTDRAAKYAGFGFDASIWEIFPYLLAGSAIYVVPEEIKLDMRRLNRFFETYHITVAFLPTQVCEVFLHIDNRSLRLLLTGGDALKRFVRRRYRLANNYGPTENTVVSTSFWVERPYDNIPIGRPVWNHRVYIMNRYGSVQPLGVPGELWVASEGLARGYLNNPELTAEKFVENSNIPLFQHSIIPVSKRSGDKFYRTGDLCRFLPDGNIEFLGRIDFQVKLRGLRIELGEIEAALLRHPEIKEAVVTVRGDGDDDKYLAAYIAPLPPNPPSKTNKTDPLKWREYLSQTLPDYMIPAYFVHLEALPLNTSGKIDRRALPAPDTAVVTPPHLASRNQVEAQLPDICRQVLAADTVGLNDDFFRLGGNSLKVIKLIAEIHRVFGVEMPVFQVFRTPRIREIARFIVQGKYRLDREELYMVFNPPGDNLLFCFPPAVGYGLAYQELAARLPEYALYAFNYIGSQDLMERYVEAVIQAQPRGPVRLFGYSAGGKLCVRAARLLEQRGLEVADIILLDCARKRRELTPGEYETLSREFIHELETGLDGLGLGFMKEKVVDRLKRYDRYWDCLDDLQPVQADIHLIRAEEKKDDEAGQDWRDLTEGEYRVLRGSGPHRDMMKPPFLDQNAAVIRQLLSPQVVITPRIRSAHRRLSDYSLEFLKYVRRRPEALALSCYESLKSGDVNDELQPWPTFVGPALLRAIRQAAEGVSALIKTIPQKIFQNDARRMSDCYGSPLNLVQTQMQGLDDQYLAGLLGRGDFVLTAGGLKCLEFNMSANLGGLALPFWESLYLQTPVISRFITELHIDIYNLNLLGLLFRHLIAAAAARGNPPGGELNIAVVLPKDETGSTGLPQQEAYLNAIYQETLLAVDRSLTGRVILTDYPHLRVADKGLRWRSQAIHVLVEMYHGVVPPEIFRLFQSGRLVLFNGPITGLLSNKLNLALLSEHRDSAAFNRQERAIIGKYIPWTRQIKATITTYRGEQVSLADLILDHRPELVIKPAVGFGGQDVFIGKFTSPRDWASLVDRALQQKKWLAQEYCDSLPLLYQTGGDGCRVHRGAWGFYVFGEKYAGGNVRLLPVHVEPGIVNVKQGAKASVIFEVAK